MAKAVKKPQTSVAAIEDEKERKKAEIANLEEKEM